MDDRCRQKLSIKLFSTGIRNGAKTSTKDVEHEWVSPHWVTVASVVITYKVITNVSAEMRNRRIVDAIAHMPAAHIAMHDSRVNMCNIPSIHRQDKCLKMLIRLLDS